MRANVSLMAGMLAAALLLSAVSAMAGAAKDPQPAGPPVVPFANAAGTTIYNGIVLPNPWPPVVTWDDLKAHKVAPKPYYLVSPPAIIPIDVGRQLFVDEFLVQETSLKAEHHLPVYHPKSPVFNQMPFSDGVFYDPQDKLFKLWYFFGGENNGYTTSKDGINWGAGKQISPSVKHDSTMVWLDQEAKDPAQRYKMTRTVLDQGITGWMYTSADGITWKKIGRTGQWGDRSTFFYNPFRGVWVFSARQDWSNPRSRRYWETKDWVNGPLWGDFPTAPYWVGADELDPQSPVLKVPCQLYNLDCAGYESVMLGLFTIWRGQPKGEEKPNDVCVGYSRDGFCWSRPDKRPFFPLDRSSWNAANVQSAGGCCLVMGDKLYFYMSGRSGKGFSTGLATLRRDGFTSMNADAAGGTLTTRTVAFKGKRMFVNVDAPQGELRVEVLDEKNAPIAPFTKENCTPIKVDSTLEAVTWKGAADLSALAGKPVRFRFHLKSGRLYAFWVSPDESGASRGYVAAGGPGFTGIADTVGRAAYEAAKKE